MRAIFNEVFLQRFQSYQINQKFIAVLSLKKVIFFDRLFQEVRLSVDNIGFMK